MKASIPLTVSKKEQFEPQNVPPSTNRCYVNVKIFDDEEVKIIEIEEPTIKALKDRIREAFQHHEWVQQGHFNIFFKNREIEMDAALTMMEKGSILIVKPDRVSKILSKLKLLNEQPDYYSIMLEAGLVTPMSKEECEEFENAYLTYQGESE